MAASSSSSDLAPLAAPGNRTIGKVITGEKFTEGAGFTVRRPIGGTLVPDLNPFLMLDEFGPLQSFAGAPNHPHRGFETVSYIKQGEIVHKDSMGNTGKLKAGDVQWMTGGHGIIHDEKPSPEFRRSDGYMHGFQLWVNLKASQKLCAPAYQDVPSSRIPVVELPEGRGRVKVIAGKHQDQKGVVTTKIPIHMMDFELNAGATVTHEVPKKMLALAYVYHGECDFGEGDKAQRVKRGQMISFPIGGEGEVIPISVPATRPKCPETDQHYSYSVGFLLLAAIPLHERIVKHGPFVMNTKEEITQAISDFQNGKLGSLPATFISKTGH